jgi:hypothetical protein
METQVKRLVIIGIVIALVMTMGPAAVAADDDIQPSTYATIPFAIFGSGLALLGDIVGIIGEATMSAVFGIPLILRRIAVYIATPMADTVNNLTAETADTAGDVCEIVNNETSLDTGWLAHILRSIACALYTPFGAQNYTSGAFNPCG